MINDLYNRIDAKSLQIAGILVSVLFVIVGADFILPTFFLDEIATFIVASLLWFVIYVQKKVRNIED